MPDRNAVDDLLAGLAASGDLVSERGVKTFLFTDIVRSTDPHGRPRFTLGRGRA